MRAAEGAGRAAAPPAPVWKLIGPRPTRVFGEFGASGNGSPYTSGRVTSLAVDPRDGNVVYIGASGGGVWKTTDGGQNWQPLTDDQPSLAIGSLAVAPSQPDIVYAGTGEQNNSGDSYYGAGVLKSTDAGATWKQLPGPFATPSSSSRLFGGAHIGALAVSPNDSNVVLAGIQQTLAATSGIYRSSDGGATWTAVLTGAAGSDLVFNPSDPTIVYAALGSAATNARNGVYKSTNGGITWDPAGGSGTTALPATNMGRIALALAPSSPNTVYAGIHNAGAAGFGSLLGLYKSSDGGQSWTRLPAPDYCTPQCSYNNVLRVNPRNPNVVVAAGLPPYRSLDGGLTWVNIAVGATGVADHTDHHALAFSADGSRLYSGSDGGVSSTSNLTATPPTWSNLDATLAITEFPANVSIHPADPNTAYAGTQDNGTQFYSGNLAWDEVVGGDGGATALDPAIPSIWYGAFQGPQIYKITGTATFPNIIDSFLYVYPILANGIQTNESSLAYPPLVMDPSNPLRLYFPTQRLYQTNDGAGTWTAISPNLGPIAGAPANISSSISAVAVSPSFPQALAAGTSNGKLQVTNSGGQTWVDRSTGLPGRSVARIVFDPVTVATFYIALSGFSGISPNDKAGHVFKTTDFGDTWTDISANLPNIPVNDIVVDPDLPGTLYIATDIGVFQSVNGGQTWSILASGLPNVLVQGLNLHRPSRTLRAVTYGRSMWDLNLPLPGASQAPHVDALAPASVSGGPNPVTITLTGSNFVTNSVVRWNGADRPTLFGDASTLSVTLSSADLAKSGRATIVVFNPVTGGGLSNSIAVPVGPAPTINPAGLTSAANPASSSPLVPGSIASIFGTSLAGGTVIAAAPPLPYTLGGVMVEVNGIPAPLYFVSPTQIDFEVPIELIGFAKATLKVVNGTLASAALEATVVLSAPTLFTANGSGSGQGAILIAGPGVMAAPAGAFPGSRPARQGEYLEIYCTGLGPVSRTPSDGAKASTAPSVSQIPSVTVGGKAAPVAFSGLAPGTAGVYQIDVQIPVGAPLGDAVPVVVSMNGTASNTVTVALGP
jgi:uncharacterized protein (TIGR03437 family)